MTPSLVPKSSFTFDTVLMCMIGDLQSVDGYMNIALERCRELVEGKEVRNWGDAFVRGNNGRS